MHAFLKSLSCILKSPSGLSYEVILIDNDRCIWEVLSGHPDVWSVHVTDEELHLLTFKTRETLKIKSESNFLGNGLDLGAHWDWDGVNGNSSGKEICSGLYWDSNWDGVLRYMGE